LTIGGLAILAVITMIQIRTNRELQYRLDMASLNLPLFGQIERNKRMVRMFYSLKLMTENGRERESIDAAIGTARGPVFRDALKRANDRYKAATVGTGGIADALADEDHLFDEVIIETLRTRERTSSLPETFQNLITMLEERIDLEIIGMPKAIESAAGITFACMIGLMAYVYLIPSSYAVAHVH
jgi:type II secretory pathway component PulF